MTSPRLLALLAFFVIVAVVAWARPGEPPDPDGEPGGFVAPEAPTISAADLPVLRPAPELAELDGWLQSDATSLEDYRGRVVVLQFWTFSCRNCKATIPNLQQIYAGYSREEVEIVGVHAPEFGFEEDPDAVLDAAADLGVTWPIALDTTKRNFHSWQEGRTAYWPRTYVIDTEGRIRFDHIGEGKYDELSETVAALVADS